MLKAIIEFSLRNKFLVLAATAIFVIERRFAHAAAFALAGAVLTFFGFMHGERIGIGQTPLVALSYLVVAALMYFSEGFDDELYLMFFLIMFMSALMNKVWHSFLIGTVAV